MPQTMSSAIAELYRLSRIPQPQSEQRVILLNELLGGYNLTCVELSGLTSEVASNYLMHRGAILEPTKDANREPLAGYICVRKLAGHIFIERDDLFVRRRFSVAHELGHYVLHFYPLLTKLAAEDEYEQVEITEALAPFPLEEEADDLPMGQGIHSDLSLHLPPYVQMENEANQFAAELLMPADNVRALVKHYASNCLGDDLIWRLATEMLVSRAAMRRRLRDLNLLPVATAQWN